MKLILLIIQLIFNHNLGLVELSPANEFIYQHRQVNEDRFVVLHLPQDPVYINEALCLHVMEGEEEVYNRCWYVNKEWETCLLENENMIGKTLIASLVQRSLEGDRMIEAVPKVFEK